MTGETIVTITGNLVADPEIRFTGKGTPVARFRVASTPRVYDRSTGQWTDGESLFITCTVWRHVAEHVCESLHSGMSVIVQGRLRQRTYTDGDGIKRTTFDLDADDVGLSLRHRIAYTDTTLPPALASPPAAPPRPEHAPAHGAPDHERRSRPQRHRGWAPVR
ncbi:single-stranded DNA-binding protein [Streptomyces sp. WAC 01325]|uniref:single-stranded DNA-binding protein n=1 Tax=Streptomyces sp. WAC 01325 TaxID=2203202 RepID=UPI000F879298|nr:single-stranded DNA-binding protein [Streptomyces sp. WAC 01325]RSN14848.1 single-stranded DNA-binding protein [Streptomyces sp. WAC 01325]